MPTWRDDKLLELANQLSYSPADKRREQLRASIELLPSIDPLKSYPWDFVHFRITGFQLRAHAEHVTPGKVLRADLATLIEFLSDTLSIKVEDASPEGDSVLALEDVTRKFNVSSKTIQRWRKQGLIALRYVYPDGRRRLGFLESAVTQFAAANKERVEKSATFKQLSDEEKARIIEMARRLAAHEGGGEHCIKQLSKRIATKLNRSPETIRYTIRRHDRDNPEAAIFPEGGGAEEVRKQDREQILQSFDSGTPLDSIAQRFSRTTTSIYRVVTQERAQKLKTLKIEFMPNPLFDLPDADNILLTLLPAQAMAAAQQTVTAGTNAKSSDPYMARIPRDLPAFLQDIFRQPVMPHELETDAFRRMNYLKYKAAKLQAALNIEAATPTDLADIDTLLIQASDIKNEILQSNLRVAVHVARKHQRIDRPLMELVSDATIWLMRAIEKYDFAHGGRQARFSTYASYAIMKNFARDRAEQLTRRDTRLLTGQEEFLNTVNSREADSAIADHIDAAHLQSDLLSVIDELPARERELVTSHYGLDQTKPALSLSEIGDKMGITKARVRQLEARALPKLRLLLDSRRQNLQKAAATPPRTSVNL
jgi:RNA polymerase sigma factor (sigma-70 family)